MRRLFFILGMSLMVLSVNAQRTSIGITGGVGTAWMSNVADNTNTMAKPAPNVGITYVCSSENHWGFGADVKYSSEGVKFKYNNNDFTTRVNSDFIRVPLRVIYFFNDYGHAIRPKVSLGPSFGFLIGGKIKTQDQDGNRVYQSDTKDSFKAFDFGVNGSVGINFRVVEDVWFSTDIAFYQGLLRQNQDGSKNMMNSNVVLNLGLTFGIGK